jgi:2,3-bisphosphoglycerate-independent phosphoglycerate mutase
MIRTFLFFLKPNSSRLLRPLILLLLLSLSLLAISGSAVNMQVGQEAEPGGAVILVVDGFGSSYAYPEHEPYALDGSPIEKAVLFNLTGAGARAVDARVPVPETTKSHAVLITGLSGVDPQMPGRTIFDAAREEDYLCLGVLERGDSKEVLQKLDAVLHLDDNAIHGAEPVPGFRDGVPQDLHELLQTWRDRFSAYTTAAGTAGYAGYNRWGLDAATDLVEHLGSRHFLLLVNVGAWIAQVRIWERKATLRRSLRWMRPWAGWRRPAAGTATSS